MNAYFIPDQPGIEALTALHGRQVKVRMLTNSLASHDLPAVKGQYKKWRKPILQAGAELFEIRPDAAIQSLVADTPPVRSTFICLHSKGVVVDHERVLIGSMNFDPRSVNINSETGVIVAACPGGPHDPSCRTVLTGSRTVKSVKFVDRCRGPESGSVSSPVSTTARAPA